jgi:hypothetical protein
MVQTTVILYKWTITRGHGRRADGTQLLKPYSNNPLDDSGHRSSKNPRTARSHGTVASTRENTGNLMVLLTLASVVVSTVIGVAWVTPVLQVTAVFPFYYSAMKQHRHRWSLVLVVRWAAALFVATVLLGVFVPARMETSLLFSVRTVATLQSWIAGSQGGPPADYPYLLWGLAVFLVGSVISGGVAGFVIGASALGGAASGTLFLFEHGNNVVHITIAAVPPWQWSLFASGALFLVPTSRPFFERFLRTERVVESKQVLLVYMYAGAACFGLSLILRLATAGIWQSFLQRWTIL